MPLEPRQRHARFIGSAGLARLGLRDPRLGHLGLRPQPPRVPSDVALGVALIDQAAGGLVAIAQRRCQQFAAGRAGRAAGDPFKSLQQPDPLRLMPGLDADRLDPRPVFLEILAQHPLLLVVEVGEKQREEITGAVLEHRLMGRIERRDHGFEQMHVRILPARHRRRQSLQKAAMRRAQMRVQERQQRVDFGADLRVAVERINAGERQQHERVVIGIAQRVQHRAIGRQDVDKARMAVGGFRLGQEMIQPLQRDFAAFGIPAHLRCLGEAIDLPGLHEHATGRETIGAAVLIEPVDKAAASSDPSLRSTTAASAWSIMRSFSFATMSAESSARGGLSFSHCVSQSVVISGASPTPVPPSDTTCKAVRNWLEHTGPAMTDHYDALETREPAEREAELFSRLPEVLRKAMAAPAYAERLRGIDPAGVTSRAALAGLPLLRKSDLPALHKSAPPFGGLVPGPPARLGGCLPRPARFSSPSPSMPTPGAARGRCSPRASGRATWC